MNHKQLNDLTSGKIATYDYASADTVIRVFNEKLGRFVKTYWREMTPEEKEREEKAKAENVNA